MSEIIWEHKCLITPANYVEQARALAGSLASAGEGMFTTGLSETGDSPATHYISVGMVDKILADLLVSVEALSVATNAPLEMCRGILDASDISDEEGHVALDRLNLQILKEI